jgi:hypothetical protein
VFVAGRYYACFRSSSFSYGCNDHDFYNASDLIVLVKNGECDLIVKATYAENVSYFLVPDSFRRERKPSWYIIGRRTRLYWEVGFVLLDGFQVEYLVVVLFFAR